MQVMARQTVFLTCDSLYLGANIPGKARLFMPLTGGFRPTRSAALAEAMKGSGSLSGFRSDCDSSSRSATTDLRQ